MSRYVKEYTSDTVWKITDQTTKRVIAQCAHREHARLVEAALNFMDDPSWIVKAHAERMRDFVRAKAFEVEERPKCPDCGRPKAFTVDEAAAGDCPKWWAINDADAAGDCVKQMEKNDFGSGPAGMNKKDMQRRRDYEAGIKIDLD